MVRAASRRSPIDRLVVVAIGGNSLDSEGGRAGLPDQLSAVRATAESIAALVTGGWRVVITHGNGPQVGQVILAAEAAKGVVPAVPLAFAVAQTQGSIGLMIQESVGNALRQRGIATPVATVVTQTLVDVDDPSFQRPSKPVGPFLSREEAEARCLERGWAVVEDSGRGWRRVVPSPRPLEIVEMATIRRLVASGAVVIAAGGGGIPVVRDPSGDLRPMDAVIDKDRASALLAVSLAADLLVISTAVDRVALNYRQSNQVSLDRLSADDAERFLRAGQFPDGSMGPKIEAAIEFARSLGRAAVITGPTHLVDAVGGRHGTWITPSQVESAARTSPEKVATAP